MRVMSWNVNKSANSAGRIDRQLEFIDDCDVDVLLLQEVRYGAEQQWVETWTDGLSELGLGEVVHSCDLAAELGASTEPPHDDIGHDNGHLTAVSDEWSLSRRADLLRAPLKASNEEATHFPEKILVADLELPDASIELWNIRAVPATSWGIEKAKIFETIYDWLTEAGSTDRILAGDLNAPDEELVDGQAIPFGYDKPRELQQRQVTAELKILKGLGHLGLIDCFRATHGYGSVETPDTSWEQKRFDHLLASQEFDIQRCYYEPTGQECSDHAPIITDIACISR